jgi:ubiquinone/menaquinone biosynthesis C-methylase UbiE
MADDNLDFRFDQRVALQYDALRGHPPDVSPVIGAALAAVTGPGARILEPGVGTGRIAKPLVAAGCEVVGIDLSANMLSSMDHRGTDRLSLVQGDITRLPFADQSFDAAMCVHVLHLVDSEVVLETLLRLVRPGGAIILARDWIDPGSFAGMLRNAFRQACVDLSDNVTSPTKARGFVQQLDDLGAQVIDSGEEKIAAQWQTELSPRQVLDGIRSRDDAESWVLPDDLLGRVMARLDSVAAEKWPDLDAPQPVTRRFVYSLFRV